VKARESVIALAAALAVACAPDTPVRVCSGCTYDFADTVPPVVVFHWPASQLPVRFYADRRGAMPALVSQGVATWESQFLYGEFTGTLVSDSGQADVIVQWTGAVPTDVPPDPGPPVPACDGVTTFPSWVSGASPGRALHVSLNPLSGYSAPQVAACLRRVVIHELGHALGLLKHSPTPTDIMYQTPAVALPSDADRMTAEVLYHTRATVTPPPR
jgi:hypothetical protein